MVASIVKTIESGNLSRVPDIAFHLYLYGIWMAVEHNAVAICASVPFLRPLFLKNQQHHPYVHRVADELELGGWKDKSLPGTSPKDFFSVSERTGCSTTSGETMPQSCSAMVGIKKTTHYTVTFGPKDISAAHAAVVGIFQAQQMECGERWRHSAESGRV